jgi:hypothetical protein
MRLSALPKAFGALGQSTERGATSRTPLGAARRGSPRKLGQFQHSPSPDWPDKQAGVGSINAHRVCIRRCKPNPSLAGTQELGGQG